ncbi:hypothetical protein EYC80_000523 [Monilinia laxa]|uniref:Uncharacterized protein n=1 Tax=Monilinia laxa TaxID=61186 RepID=A0A5N6KAV9_MONLA|nr:hypothetical protein EYC80_000523 [Monilinia laxa]
MYDAYLPNTYHFEPKAALQQTRFSTQAKSILINPFSNSPTHSTTHLTSNYYLLTTTYKSTTKSFFPVSPQIYLVDDRNIILQYHNTISQYRKVTEYIARLIHYIISTFKEFDKKGTLGVSKGVFTFHSCHLFQRYPAASNLLVSFQNPTSIGL